VILSRYDSRQPHSLLIERTASGKPYLQPSWTDGVPISFNLTHSHGRALIAVAASRGVGIDLEQVTARRDAVGLAKRFLSPPEQAAVEQADGETREEVFLRFWVAREAVLKAVGTGLVFPLDLNRVELTGDGKEARLVGPAPDETGSDHSIRFLPVGAGWVAAVAARGNDWRVRLCHADEE
jgi:4'-phosphopantetheinyl transferase